MNIMIRRCMTVSTLIGVTVFIIFFYIPEPTDNLKVLIHIEKANHKPAAITDQSLRSLANSVNIYDFQNILKPILVERVVGTPGHVNVKNYITGELQRLNWSVEHDSFVATTPNKGRLRFTNIIATYNVHSPRYLVLACHYDSKLSNFVFIGATDSAVPCAMLLYFAKSMNNMLKQLASNVSLKLIFFDGEEAFVSWTAKDSLYGSRHLARLLETRKFATDGEIISDLNKMDLLVLLDLLGTSSPNFYSYFEDSHRWYKLLVSIEQKLNSLRLLLQPDTNQAIYKPYFHDQILYGAQIDDDHKPFLRRGVPCLHIIPSPFPDVWHTEDDNESAIDMQTVKNLLAIFKVFIVQYLNGSSET